MNGRGFTLVEVLVALTIVALGMGALLSTLTSSADSVAYLREKSFAQWVGLNQLTAERMSLKKATDAITEGDATFAGIKWHWKQKVASIDFPGVHRVIVQVKRAATGASSDSNSKDANWEATVVGFRGDDLASPSGEGGDWDTTPL